MNKSYLAHMLGPPQARVVRQIEALYQTLYPQLSVCDKIEIRISEAKSRKGYMAFVCHVGSSSRPFERAIGATPGRALIGLRELFKHRVTPPQEPAMDQTKYNSETQRLIADIELLCRDIFSEKAHVQISGWAGKYFVSIPYMYSEGEAISDALKTLRSLLIANAHAKINYFQHILRAMEQETVQAFPDIEAYLGQLGDAAQQCQDLDIHQDTSDEELRELARTITNNAIEEGGVRVSEQAAFAYLTGLKNSCHNNGEETK